MNEEEEEERYGIHKEFSHPKAIELIPDNFFWDCVDELAPFGSDEGDTALAEYREWRKENPRKSIVECLIWVIEDVGDMDFKDFNNSLLDRDLIKSQLDSLEFDYDYDFFNCNSFINIYILSSIAFCLCFCTMYFINKKIWKAQYFYF